MTPLEVIIAYIDAHRDEFGVEPICRVLTEHGRYVLIGHDQYGTAGRRWLGSLPRMAGLMLGPLRSAHLPRPDFAGPGPDAMPELARLAAEGRLRPIIDRTFPLAEAAAEDRIGRVMAHFYSFGGVAATGRWAAAAKAGRIVLDRGDGFRVEPP